MKTFIAILFVATLAADLTAAGPSSETDFRTIDESGGYHFGYNDGRIARQEERSPEGVVRGAYTYVDADGQIQVVTYTADKHNGFLVSGTNIPKTGRIPEIGEVGEVIEQTPSAFEQEAEEVAVTRAENAEAFNRAIMEDVNSAHVMMQALPLPVEYTPEVAAARAAHLNAHRQEMLRSGGVAYVGAQFHPDYLPYAGL